MERVQTDPKQFIFDTLLDAQKFLLRKNIDATKKENYLKKMRSLEIRYIEKRQ